MSTNQAHAAAVQGGLQGWSVGAPYPYLVVAIDNPSGMPQGLYWYVVDTRKGSTDFKDRIGATHKGKLASEYAHCQADALYRHDILGQSIHEAQKAYDPYWAKARAAQTGAQ